MAVRYRGIAGFAGYKVGSDGSVWSCRWPGKRGALTDQWHQLKPSRQYRGHRLVSLQRAGREHQRYVHRLVLEAFVGPCPPRMECRHFPDPDPSNNRLDNLQWGTRKQNMIDRLAHGSTGPRGELNSHAKLTEDDVRDIRSIYATGLRTYEWIADRYGVSFSNVRCIIKRRSWKHVS